MGGVAIAIMVDCMATPILRIPQEVYAACEAAREGGQRVGFVPTMGALHEGHLALVQEAKRHAAFVIVSIFVNPTQFGPGDDLARYPRDLDGDVRKLAALGVDAAFAPDPAALYPEGEGTRVRVGAVAEPLCGRFRPGHFDGVATVVTKFFCLVGPCAAVFGTKDYQQWLVVRRLVRDLLLPVEVIGHPIVREPDGLAMSSRNAYLSPDERREAVALWRGLSRAKSAFEAGELDPRVLEGLAREPIAAVASSVEYVELRDAETLAPIDGRVQRRAVLAVACRVGGTRLIDNAVLAPAAVKPEGR